MAELIIPGFALTGGGTSTLQLAGGQISVDVENMGRQISDYLATHPRINSKTLFVVWGGANDVLNATSPTQVINAAIQETLDIQRLIAAGATQILVLNLPPWA
jgi:phospholipase/lecithinase/hemolysin